ncbi:MAG: NMD3-related protein [Candidatus Ranarchaeia archaeon]
MSPERFCAECGITNVDFVENLCYKCFFKNNIPFKIKKLPETRICVSCYAIYEDRKWNNPNKKDLKEILWKAVYNSIKKAIKLEQPWKTSKLQEDLFSEIKPQTPDIDTLDNYKTNKIPVVIEISWEPSSGSLPIKYEKHVYANITKSICTKCSQIKRGYNEAILQIRITKYSGKKELQKIVDFVINEVKQFIKHDSKAVVTEVNPEKNGVDLSLNNKASAKTIALYLKRKYDGQNKTSFKQVTFKNGVHLKRLVISVKIGKDKIAKKSLQ